MNLQEWEEKMANAMGAERFKKKVVKSVPLEPDDATPQQKWLMRKAGYTIKKTMGQRYYWHRNDLFILDSMTGT